MYMTKYNQDLELPEFQAPTIRELNSYILNAGIRCLKDKDEECFSETIVDQFIAFLIRQIFAGRIEFEEVLDQMESDDFKYLSIVFWTVKQLGPDIPISEIKHNSIASWAEIQIYAENLRISLKSAVLRATEFDLAQILFVQFFGDGTNYDYRDYEPLRPLHICAAAVVKHQIDEESFPLKIRGAINYLRKQDILDKIHA